VPFRTEIASNRACSYTYALSVRDAGRSSEKVKAQIIGAALADNACGGSFHPIVNRAPTPLPPSTIGDDIRSLSCPVRRVTTKQIICNCWSPDAVLVYEVAASAQHTTQTAPRAVIGKQECAIAPSLRRRVQRIGQRIKLSARGGAGNSAEAPSHLENAELTWL
jgi:hypothetical protein